MIAGVFFFYCLGFYILLVCDLENVGFFLLMLIKNGLFSDPPAFPKLLPGRGP